MKSDLNGSCLCGAITYSVSGPLRPVIACHCTQCRKTSGHHVAATSVARNHLAVRGTVTWFVSSGRAKRGFCGTCGSNMFWDGAGQNVSIFAGTFDDDLGVELAAHIYCADKGSYYRITDNLPQREGNDAEFTTMW
ncbi:MAG: GFA family protein [Pseudomonadota bacterium]